MKTLAIRERKIHVVGKPELPMDSTPVFLDVEGLPDRDFYYLVGGRVEVSGGAVHRSLWADSPADENKIWEEFLDILSKTDRPMLAELSQSIVSSPALTTSRFIAFGLAPISHSSKRAARIQMHELLRTQTIARFKPRERTEVVSQFSLGPAGKILKRQLHEMIAARMEDLRAGARA